MSGVYDELLLERNLRPERRGSLEVARSEGLQGEDGVVVQGDGEARVAAQGGGRAGVQLVRTELVNASCGDKLTVELAVERRPDGEGRIVDGRWSGQGCAIAQASADLMVGELIGKTVAEAHELKRRFEQMIYGRRTQEGLGDVGGMNDGDEPRDAGEMDDGDELGELDDAAGEPVGLGDLRALECVARMPARGKCASLAWGAVEKLGQ